MIERRQEPRTPARNRGVIKFGASGQELPCTVHDLSPRGAGLSVGTTFGLPRVFQLAIDGEKGTRFCRVAWTAHQRVGVSFE